MLYEKIFNLKDKHYLEATFKSNYLSNNEALENIAILNKKSK